MDPNPPLSLILPSLYQLSLKVVTIFTTFVRLSRWRIYKLITEWWKILKLLSCPYVINCLFLFLPGSVPDPYYQFKIQIRFRIRIHNTAFKLSIILYFNDIKLSHNCCARNQPKSNFEKPTNFLVKHVFSHQMVLIRFKAENKILRSTRLTLQVQYTFLQTNNKILEIGQ